MLTSEIIYAIGEEDLNAVAHLSDKDKIRATEIAAANDTVSIVKYFLTHGVDYNKVFLETAVMEESTAIIKYLITDYAANINMADIVIKAATLGTLDSLEALTNNTQNTYLINEQLLEYVIKTDTVSSIKYLIGKGVNVYYDNYKGFRVAVKNESLGAIRFFLSLSGIPVNIMSEEVSISQSLRSIMLLARAGADLHYNNSNLLVISANNGREDIIKYILMFGSLWRSTDGLKRKLFW